MKELATLLLKSLSATPDNVVVNETVEENRVFLTTKVDAADKGKVIGKDGCIIKAVRTVLNAAALSQNKKVTLKLEDE
jgi:predicted RNA-binding protein YlqC (UPF0109 family)